MLGGGCGIHRGTPGLSSTDIWVGFAGRSITQVRQSQGNGHRRSTGEDDAEFCAFGSVFGGCGVFAGSVSTLRDSAGFSTIDRKQNLEPYPFALSFSLQCLLLARPVPGDYLGVLHRWADHLLQLAGKWVQIGRSCGQWVGCLP